MIEETIAKLIKAFPDWKESLSKPHSPEKKWEYIVSSPSGKANLIITISDRLNIKFGKENLEFFHAEESLETLRNIINDNLVCVEYYLDFKLASELGQDTPEGIPEYQGGSLVKVDDIPSQNTDWYFANKIKVTSWQGNKDNDMVAIYGK